MNKILYDILIIGAGGTGSVVIDKFARFMATCDTTISQRINSVAVCDGDIIEEKNLKNQFYQQEDVARCKAEVSVEIVNEVFGLNWNALPYYINTDKDILNYFKTRDNKRYRPANVNYIPVILGCVDNHACRMACENYFNSVDSCIYYDSANEFRSGQCVYSARIKGKTLSPCRSVLFPEILKNELKAREEMSCTELNAVEPQHILTNTLAGIHILTGIIRLLEDNFIMRGVSFFDSASLYGQHLDADSDEFKKMLKLNELVKEQEA